MTPAQAADLGGDCCADLEERVAELEATTVRHGNRKVKLTLSGQVNSALLYFDDGRDSDVYVIDSDEASTRMRLDAVGTISPGVTAGLVIEYDIEIAGGSRIGGRPAAANDGGQINPEDDGDGIQLRRANWYVAGSLGKVSVGQGSAASDGAFEVSFSNAWLGSVGYGLGVTNIGNFTLLGRSMYALGTDNDQGRINRVRYDSPTFAGFTLSGSWGEDDFYDVAARYANEFGGVKIAAAAAYIVDRDDEGAGDTNERDTWGISAAAQFQNVHLEGGYSNQEIENAAGAPVFERSHWWVAAGVQFRASSLGSTDITVDYINNENTTFGTDETEYESFGIGLGQNIDSVGGTIYLSYRHHDVEVSRDFAAGGLALGDNADFDQVTFGMRLKY